MKFPPCTLIRVCTIIRSRVLEYSAVLSTFWVLSTFQVRLAYSFFLYSMSVCVLHSACRILRSVCDMSTFRVISTFRVLSAFLVLFAYRFLSANLKQKKLTSNALPTWKIYEMKTLILIDSVFKYIETIFLFWNLKMEYKRFFRVSLIFQERNSLGCVLSELFRFPNSLTKVLVPVSKLYTSAVTLFWIYFESSQSV